MIDNSARSSVMALQMPPRRPKRGLSRARVAAGILAVGLLFYGASDLLAKPIRVRTTDDLTFGQITSDVSQSGSVIIAAASGAKTTTGGATDLGGTHSRSIFSITGDKDVAFSISMPSSVTLNGSGADTVTVDSFTSDPAGSGVLSASGQATLNVGATLNLNANHPAGSYSGAYDVIVNYQ